MSQRHSLHFEALETRELLSTVHAARAHAAARPRAHHAAVAAIPLVLNGTLTLNSKQAVSSPNLSGGMTLSVPVSGQLGSLGVVHGTWYESSDSMGNYSGPDMINLRSSQGSFTVSFNNGTPGPAHSSGNGTVYYQHTQHAGSGTGAFTGQKETGTIDTNMNHAHTTVESITLSTKGS